RVNRLERADRPSADSRPPDTRIPRGSEPGAPGGRGQRGQRGGQRTGGGPRPDRPPGGGGQRGGQRSGGGGDRSRGGGGSRGAGLEAATPKLTEQDFLRAPSYDTETEGAAPPDTRGRSDRGERSGPPPRQRPPGRGDRDRERRPREDEPEIEPDINAEEVDFAAHVTDDLLRILDINADINIREPLTPGDGKGAVLAVIDIMGDDLGLLIGRRGETLMAMQYLVNLIVTRRFTGRPGVTLDVEHYRHRREEQVVALAQRMADRVRQTGSAITLEPMTAAERRLVHLLFAEDAELETNSIGEGENRKVVISARN
ncbi:MAG: R3H domain-containing nucleic acid-binding protein, partial [Dehalococcoidia bacterium]